MSTTFDICVAGRNTTTENFSIPLVLFSENINLLIETPTLATGKQMIYYHKKTLGVHKIVMRRRERPLNILSLLERHKKITFT